MPQNEPIEIVDDRKSGRLLAVEDGAVVGFIAYFVLAEAPTPSWRSTPSSNRGTRAAGSPGTW